MTHLNRTYQVDPDIRKAETLPGSFYKDREVFEYLKESIFIKSWHWIGDTGIIPLSNSTFPFTLFENFIDEPLLLTRDQHDTHKVPF